MTLGILGAGQLGKMLAQAGKALGVTCTLLDPSADACGGSEGHLIVGSYDDASKLEELAKASEVITYEFENVPVASVQTLEKLCIVHPSSSVLLTTQDRIHEKELAQSLGIKTAPYAAVSAPEDLTKALSTIGLPCIIKTRRMGYDGKGQWRIGTQNDLPDAATLAAAGPLIVEGFVDFDAEVSFIAARSEHGDIRFFPPARNDHRNGILHTSIVPAGLPTTLVEKGRAALRMIMEHLRYVGVCTMECFVHGDELLLNELAPRVHNSGHWTIEGCATSQFEQHVRAILGLPLLPTDTQGFWGMVNLVGTMPSDDALSLIPDAHVHRYGKVAKPGRKLGHVTIGAATQEGRDSKIAMIEKIIGAKRA